VVELLPGKCEDPYSTPRTTKKKKQYQVRPEIFFILMGILAILHKKTK
jgi:hypothetical protein